MRAVTALALLLALAGVMVWLAAIFIVAGHQCEDKGGTFIQGRCLKVERVP